MVQAANIYFKITELMSCLSTIPLICVLSRSQCSDVKAGTLDERPVKAL